VLADTTARTAAAAAGQIASAAARPG